MLNLSRTQWAGIWPACLFVLTACAAIGGVRLTVADGALLLVACLAPPAIMLLVWRGPPPPTVAEVLYLARVPSADGGAR